MVRWLWVLGGWLIVPALASAATLSVWPATVTVGAGGVAHASPFFDPDGGGPLPGRVINWEGAQWSLADVGIATVSPLGVVTGRSPGTTVLAASSGALSAQAVVEVRGTVFSRSLQTPDGRTRSFALYVPPGAGVSGPAPLVLGLHGGGGDGLSMAALTNMDAVAAREGFLVAYPDAVDGHWNDGRGIAAYLSQAQNIDDVRFLSRVIDAVAAEFAVDRRRVFAMGFSNGSLMAKRLAREWSFRIAAIAAGGSTLPRALADGGGLARPVPLLDFHSVDDQHAFYSGGDLAGGNTLSVPELLHFWAQKNSCRPPAAAEPLPDAVDEGTSAEREDYLCPDGAALIFYRFVGAGGGIGPGHTWPGGFQYFPMLSAFPEFSIGRTNQDVDMSETVWAFFAAHPLPAPPESPAAVRLFPNPLRTGEAFFMDRVPFNADVRVYDIRGRVRRRLVPDNAGQLIWDARDDEGRDLPSGIYFVHIDGGGHQTVKAVIQR